MNISSIQKNRARSRVRSTPGLVLVAMLNLVFQPCVMAADMDSDHDCPHCPAAFNHDQNEHDQHLGEVSDCDYIGTFNHDTRTTQSSAKDTSHELPFIVDNTFLQSAFTLTSYAHDRAFPEAAYAGEPSLNILYCVYLK